MSSAKVTHKGQLHCLLLREMDDKHYITEAHMAIFGDTFEFNACLIYVNVCLNRNLEHIVKFLLFHCIIQCKGRGMRGRSPNGVDT